MEADAVLRWHGLRRLADSAGPAARCKQCSKPRSSSITGQHVPTVASGRTDAGVHALGQVVSCAADCRLDAKHLQRALNANLPLDIRVREAVEAPAGFHAIRDAVKKRYRYVLQDGLIPDVFLRNYSCFVPAALDEQSMQRSAQALVGTHDFSSFQASGAPRASSVRTVVELVVRRVEDEPSSRIFIEIEADGFLYKMVRNIVGSLLEVGQGRRPEDWPGQVLAARDRRRAGRTAPARGLFLLRVDYPAAPERPMRSCGRGLDCPSGP